MPDRLDQVVRATRRRLTLQRLELRLARSLRYVLTAAVVLLAADRVWRLRFEPWYVVMPALALAILVALAFSRRKVTELEAALVLDDRLGLEERLSSALAVRGLDHPLRDALLADAQRYLAELDPKRALPHRWPAETKLCLGLLLLLLVTTCLPQFGFWRSESDRATEMVTRQVGQELVERAKEIEAKADRLGDAKVRAEARALLREALKLRRARVTKEQALRQLEQANQRLQDQREELAGHPLRKTGQEARRDLRQMGDLEAKIADRLEDQTASDAQQLLQEAARAAKEGRLAPEDAKRLADQLRRAAEALKGSPHEGAAKQLEQAAKALEKAAKSGDKQTQKEAAEQLERAADSLCQGDGSCDSQDLLEELQDGAQGGKGAIGDAEGLYGEGQQQRGGECPDGLCDRYGSNPGGGAGRNRGPGSTNRGATPTPSEGAPQYPYQEGDSPRDDTQTEYERLYAPRRTETLQHDERSQGHLQRGGSFRTEAGPREAPKLSDAQVPYYEVLGDYQAEADDALSKGDIPLTERQRVQSYFQELQGQRDER